MGNSTNNFEDRLIQEEATKVLWSIIPPIFIIVGTIGNLLSVIILTRPKIIQSTSALYLIVLAFSDTFVLYTGLMRQWIEHAFNWNIRHHSEAGCKIHVFLTYLSLDFSSWLLVAVTLDRLVLVYFPHKARRKCTKSVGCSIISMIFIFLTLLNSHIFYGNGNSIKIENNVSTISYCDYKDEMYEFFFHEIWPWIDLATFCLFPFCILLIGNTFICLKLISWRKAKNRRTSSVSGSKQQSTVSSITLMMFSLNVAFLVTTTPISVFNLNDKSGYKPTRYQQAERDLIWSICNILMYANNTFNFLLYIFSGNRFRSVAKSLMYQFLSNLKCLSQSKNSRIKLNDDTKEDITHDNVDL